MTNQGEESGAISHVGPVPNVSVHAHMRSGPHAITADPLDLVVVVEMMFLFGEQARRRASDDPLVITPQSVLERLREMGVRSGNGSRLVGRDAVYASFARLRAKGYIRRILGSDEKTGQRTGVAYEFYDWPAWNPDAPEVSESSQVGATSGIAGSGNAGSRTGNRTKKRSPQVGATSGNAGSGDAGSSEFPQVAPTSGNAGSPPHPPEEEVGTTSPSPHKHATASRRNKGETPVVDSASSAAAAQFLMRLPGKWALGVQRAQSLAPWLVHNCELTGWELGMALRHYLTRAEPEKGPVKNYGATLGYRIKDMQPRDAVMEAASEESAGGEPQGQQPPARPGVPEWCGKCESSSYRWFAPEDGPAKKCPECNPAVIIRGARSGA